MSEPPLHTSLVSYNCMLLSTLTGGGAYYVDHADNNEPITEFYFHFGVVAVGGVPKGEVEAEFSERKRVSTPAFFL